MVSACYNASQANYLSRRFQGNNQSNQKVSEYAHWVAKWSLIIFGSWHSSSPPTSFSGRIRARKHFDLCHLDVRIKEERHAFLLMAAFFRNKQKIISIEKIIKFKEETFELQLYTSLSKADSDIHKKQCLYALLALCFLNIPQDALDLFEAHFFQADLNHFFFEQNEFGSVCHCRIKSFPQILREIPAEYQTFFWELSIQVQTATIQWIYCRGNSKELLVKTLEFFKGLYTMQPESQEFFWKLHPTAQWALIKTYPEGNLKKISENLSEFLQKSFDHPDPSAEPIGYPLNNISSLKKMMSFHVLCKIFSLTGYNNKATFDMLTYLSKRKISEETLSDNIPDPFSSEEISNINTELLFIEKHWDMFEKCFSLHGEGGRDYDLNKIIFIFYLFTLKQEIGDPNSRFKWYFPFKERMPELFKELLVKHYQLLISLFTIGNSEKLQDLLHSPKNFQEYLDNTITYNDPFYALLYAFENRVKILDFLPQESLALLAKISLIGFLSMEREKRVRQGISLDNLKAELEWALDLCVDKIQDPAQKEILKKYYDKDPKTSEKKFEKMKIIFACYPNEKLNNKLEEPLIQEDQEFFSRNIKTITQKHLQNKIKEKEKEKELGFKVSPISLKDRATNVMAQHRFESNYLLAKDVPLPLTLPDDFKKVIQQA